MRLKDLLLSMANDTHLTSYVTTWQTGHYSSNRKRYETQYETTAITDFKYASFTSQLTTFAVGHFTYVGPMWAFHTHPIPFGTQRDPKGWWIVEKEGVQNALTEAKTSYFTVKVTRMNTQKLTSHITTSGWSGYTRYNTSQVTQAEVE